MSGIKIFRKEHLENKNIPQGSTPRDINLQMLQPFDHYMLEASFSEI